MNEMPAMDELIGLWGPDPSALSDQILKAFSGLAFGNSYTLHPRQLRQISQTEAKRFLEFLAAAEEQPISELGNTRAREGLGLPSVLALGRLLRQSCIRASQSDGASSLGAAIAAVDRFMDAYLTGYVQGREADLLMEQERTRKAYFAALFGRNEGSTGSHGSPGSG